MRISSYLKEYLEAEKYYKENNLEVPSQLKADYEAKEYLDRLSRLLHKCADGNAISNTTWRFLQEVNENRQLRLDSNKWAARVEAAQREMALLYTDLQRAENGFLIDRNTLNKNGRKRVRESAFRISDLLSEKKRTD